MFFHPQKKIIKLTRRLFRKRPWIILLVAVVMFVSFTTAIVYEQYVMNQDNLAKYLPPDTVFYFHANTLKSSFINKSWADFLSNHARFKKLWLDGWQEKYFSAWPRLNGSDHQEVAFALLPKDNVWQPVLLLFLRSENGIQESINKWQAEGWRVSRLDNVVAVSREPFYQWNTGEANLAKVLLKKKIPLANQFYVYFAKNNIDQWLRSLTDNKLLLRFFSYWQTSEQSAWYFFIRGNGLLITDNPSILGENALKNKEEWIDKISGDDSLVFKNVNLRTLWDFASENKDLFLGTRFDLVKMANKMRHRYSFDVLNSLILKSSAPANIYIGNFSQSQILSLGKSGGFYIFDLPVGYDFSLFAWEEFLKTAAGFYFPVEVEKILPDGTRYKVKQARKAKDLRIKRENLPSGFVLNSIRVGNEVWDWHYVYKNGRLLVGNNKDMLSAILLGKVPKSKTNQHAFCPSGGGAYLKYLPSFFQAAALGVDFILFKQTDSGFLVCAQ